MVKTAHRRQIAERDIPITNTTSPGLLLITGNFGIVVTPSPQSTRGKLFFTRFVWKNPHLASRHVQKKCPPGWNVP